MKNIYFCGFMGCGKSTVTKEVSRRLNLPGYDLDQLITQYCNLEIPEIFKKYGESYFRQIETQVLKDTENLTPALIATGGGILTNPQNGAILRELGILIYLETPFSLCYWRIQGDQNRPLAVSKSREELLALYQQRDLLYRKYSHYIVPCENGIDSVTEKVLNLIKKG